MVLKVEEAANPIEYCWAALCCLHILSQAVLSFTKYTYPLSFTDYTWFCGLENWYKEDINMSNWQKWESQLMEEWYFDLLFEVKAVFVACFNKISSCLGFHFTSPTFETPKHLLITIIAPNHWIKEEKVIYYFSAEFRFRYSVYVNFYNMYKPYKLQYLNTWYFSNFWNRKEIMSV